MISRRLASRLRSIDWDFARNYSESPFSSIHWHPARFASQLPATLIGLLSSPGDLVLDPFVGSGTTLVEAQRLSRRSIGIDLNPIACLAARAKTLAISARAIEAAIKTIKEEAAISLGREIGTHKKPRASPLIPDSVQEDKWYTRRLGDELGILWHLIQSYGGTKRILAEAAFSAVLLPVCRETRHWGYVCDNSSPKGKHEGDALREFVQILDRLCSAYHERDTELRARSGESSEIRKAEVVCADARKALMTLARESVDLVVTSPPYFGVSDYVKAQRLSMEWFGLAIEPLRLLEIGARSKRHRLSACEEYVSELAEVFGAVERCLRKGCICAVIIGESSTRNSIVSEIKEVLSSCHLNLEVSLNRRVSSQRRQAPSITGENLLILIK